MTQHLGRCSSWPVEHHRCVTAAAYVETGVGATFVPMLFTVEPPAASRRSLRASHYQVAVTFLAAGRRGEGSLLVAVISVSGSSCGRQVVWWTACQSRRDVPSLLPPPGEPVSGPAASSEPPVCTCDGSSLGTRFAGQRGRFAQTCLGAAGTAFQPRSCSAFDPEVARRLFK